LKDLPISYEASYRLSSGSKPQPIYRGLGTPIAFQLPAGTPDNNTGTNQYHLVWPVQWPQVTVNIT